MKKNFYLPLFCILLLGSGCDIQSLANSPQYTNSIVEQSSLTAPKIESQNSQNKEEAQRKVLQTNKKDTYAPNGTYTNTSGNEVPSPYYAPSIPAGATALCADGTYSFSQSRRGTCSHHGGVAEWL